MAYLVARLVSNKAISLIGAARATPMSALQPVFALALGISFLGERPNMLVSRARHWLWLGCCWCS
ncbi:MAG: DMT family transporter [Dehalococcoidia bacterium]|nr:DMT family transporter [Dehalococcoidia bacterium]